MISQSLAVKLSQVSLDYSLYQKPFDRVKEALHPFRKKYHTTHAALKNISLDIGWGETVGIVGKNGCGKSTLLQIVCSIMPPSSGTSQCNGRISPILELGGGFNPELSGRNNIYLKCSISGMRRGETDGKVDSIVAFADIGKYIDQPTKTYSSGMTARLAFAIAISVDPDILIVDEILSVGDAAFQRKCYSRIKKIQAQGSTILFVSHNAGAIVDLCDRAVLLDQGEMLYSGLPKEVMARYHKMVFAPVENLEEIRRQIQVEGTSSTEQQSQELDIHPSEIVSQNTPVMQATKQNGPPPNDDCIPNLKPKSTQSYQPNGAIIESPCITTLDGRKVNRLTRNQEYQVCYKVHFHQSVFKVHFGTLIKTVRGVELGGYGKNMNDTRMDYIESGSEAVVKLRFTCALAPGTYFLNVGVKGILEETEEFLHRIIDAAMFEVKFESKIGVTGIVDFGIVPDIEIKDTSN